MIAPYRSLQDVLRSPWAQPGALSKGRGGTTDRLLRSTHLEDSIYADLRSGDQEMDLWEKEASSRLSTFPALTRDVFQSFYALNPRRVDGDDLSPTARKFNAHLLDHIVGQEDYPTLKSICEGRELLAFDAAEEFTSRVADRLDELLADLGGGKGALNTLEKLMAARDQAKKDLAGLLEQQRRSSGPNETLEKALVSSANRVESKQRQVEAVSKMIDTSFTRRSGTTDTLVASALASAQAKAQETASILAAWGDDPGNMSRSPANLELLEQVRQSQKLKDISRYLGRFREMVAQGKKNGYAYGRGETYSLELGSDLSRALTSELAMLATPETAPLFLRKYQQKQIKQYRRREPVYKGAGDIICCLDESGSTQGDAAAWGKAVAMTLLDIAADSGRKFALIHFSGVGSVETDVFFPGKYDVSDKLRAAETFLGGGTDFTTPLVEATRLMEEFGFENADVVFITDGECALPEIYADELRSQQEKNHFTVTGVLLDTGTPGMDFSLKSFCQNIYRTSEVAGDEIAMQLILSSA